MFHTVLMLFLLCLARGDCDKRGLCDRDVGETFHCLVKSGFLLVVDHLNASVKDLRIPLNLLHDVQQSSSDFVVPLNVIHSHVFNVLVSWCYNLNDIVEESIADQRNDARQVAIVVSENDWMIRLDEIAQVTVDMWRFLVVFRHR